MGWLEVSISTSRNGIEFVCAALYNLGINGIEIVDNDEIKNLISENVGQWDYVDESLLNLPNTPPLVKLYLSDDVYGYDQLTSIKATLSQLEDMDTGSLEIKISNVNDEDWANNWKKYFKPFSIGNKLIIKPSWETLDPKNFSGLSEKKVIEIDPGAAFGSGMHETTQLCLEMLEKYTKESDKVLDIGCGSGILSIATLLLGADFVQGLDLDPIAVKTTISNLKINNIKNKQYVISTGNILEDFVPESKFNIVVANIVADVIIMLAPNVKNYLDNNGIFICSGIIDSRILDVESALCANGFDIIESHLLKDWSVIVSRKTAKILSPPLL